MFFRVCYSVLVASSLALCSPIPCNEYGSSTIASVNVVRSAAPVVIPALPPVIVPAKPIAVVQAPAQVYQQKKQDVYFVQPEHTQAECAPSTVNVNVQQPQPVPLPESNLSENEPVPVPACSMDGGFGTGCSGAAPFSFSWQAGGAFPSFGGCAGAAGC